MAKYNSKRTTNVVKNSQGGSGVKFAPEMELVSLLATGLDGRFYEKETDRESRLVSLIKEIGQKDPELVAKALVYARSVMGQRSVTHVGAVALAPYLSGSNLATRFYTKRARKENKGGVVYRIDDMLEILAYYFMRNPNKPLPNALKRGFKKALESADTYELAKYQGKNRAVSLVDVVRLTRPKPSEKMEEVFKNLLDGKLKQFNTSEDKNTKAGQDVAKKVAEGTITQEEAKAELKQAKADNWKQLISDGTLGYLALLRNLRNIVTVSDNDTFVAGMAMLTDPKRVKESLVFPHQIDLAFEVLLQEASIPSGRKNPLLKAVNEAYELSIPNLQELFSYGRTAVVFDTSGSMQGGWNGGVKVNGKGINTSPVEKAALIAATFVKGVGGDMYHFATNCEKLNYNPLDSINTIKSVGTGAIGRVGHGTSFDSIFRTLEGKYDRVFIVSDMQGGDSIVRGSSYQSYVRQHGQPYVYAIDLVGYGTTMFKQSDKLINLFGYSKDIYEMVKQAEIDPKQILKEIRAIEI